MSAAATAVSPVPVPNVAPMAPVKVKKALPKPPQSVVKQLSFEDCGPASASCSEPPSYFGCKDPEAMYYYLMKTGAQKNLKRKADSKLLDSTPMWKKVKDLEHKVKTYELKEKRLLADQKRQIAEEQVKLEAAALFEKSMRAVNKAVASKEKQDKDGESDSSSGDDSDDEDSWRFAFKYLPAVTRNTRVRIALHDEWGHAVDKMVKKNYPKERELHVKMLQKKIDKEDAVSKEIQAIHQNHVKAADKAEEGEDD